MDEIEREFWSAWRMRWIPRMFVIAPLFAMGMWFTCDGLEHRRDTMVRLETLYWQCTRVGERGCNQWSAKWSVDYTYPAVTVHP